LSPRPKSHHPLYTSTNTPNIDDMIDMNDATDTAVVPAELDVLCDYSMSAAVANHSGNVRFRSIVDQYRHPYNAYTSTLANRMGMIEEVVRLVQRGGSRFLSRIEEWDQGSTNSPAVTLLWRTMTNLDAFVTVFQAFEPEADASNIKNYFREWENPPNGRFDREAEENGDWDYLDIDHHSSNDDDYSESDDSDCEYDRENIEMLYNEEETVERMQRLMLILHNESKLPILFRNRLRENVSSLMQDMEYFTRGLLYELRHDRDTEAQVKNAVSFFPNVLSQCTSRFGGGKNYPIHEACRHLNPYTTSDAPTCNKRGVKFVPALAELGIQKQQFDEDLRGGIFAKNYDGFNTLELLASCGTSTSCRTQCNEHPDRLDEQPYREAIQGLRMRNLLRKQDVVDHRLLRVSLGYTFDNFPHERAPCNDSKDPEIFRYLVQWIPEELAARDPCSGTYPLHATFGRCNGSVKVRTRAYESALRAGMRYFPHQLGFLFHKDANGITPFQNACAAARGGTEEALATALRICFDDNHNTESEDEEQYNDRAPKPTLPSMESLLCAASNDAISLDSVYLQLLHDPILITRSLAASEGNLKSGNPELGSKDRIKCNPGTTHCNATATSESIPSSKPQKRRTLETSSDCTDIRSSDVHLAIQDRGKKLRCALEQDGRKIHAPPLLCSHCLK